MFRLGNGIDEHNAATARKNLAPTLTSAELPDMNWYRVPVPEGICSDGSEYYIYLRKGTSENLCILFSGGGAAWDWRTISQPNSTGRLLAGMECYYQDRLCDQLEPGTIHAGITDIANPGNPFRDWNFAAIMYASADLHVGDGSYVFTDGGELTRTVHFHGYRNYLAALERIVRFFPNPKKLLIAGDSAGAFAVPAHTAQIADAYPNCADITALADSCHVYNETWRNTVENIWKAPESIWRCVDGTDVALCWFKQLYRQKEDRIRYLYTNSVFDGVLSVFESYTRDGAYEISRKRREQYKESLLPMLKELRESVPGIGMFIHELKPALPLRLAMGGSVHTVLRNECFYQETPSGDSPLAWILDALEGNVRSVGLEYLEN